VSQLGCEHFLLRERPPDSISLKDFDESRHTYDDNEGTACFARRRHGAGIDSRRTKGAGNGATQSSSRATESRIVHALLQWLDRRADFEGDVFSGEAGSILQQDPDTTVGIWYSPPASSARGGQGVHEAHHVPQCKSM